MGAYSERLHAAVQELTPYLDSYYRDFVGDDCYAAFVEAVYMNRDGSIVGVSHHCMAPTPDMAEVFREYTLAQTDSLLGALVPPVDCPRPSEEVA